MKITSIKGISEKREKEFAKLGIYDTKDLVKHFPRAFLDLTKEKRLEECFNNEFVLTHGSVISIPKMFTAKSSMKYVKIICEQNGVPFTVIWFNQPYVLQKLDIGKEYLFYGRVKNEYGQATLTNPSFERITENYRLKGIVPQYSLTSNLTQKIMRDAITVALRVEDFVDAIPQNIQTKYALAPISSAYKDIHNPTTMKVCRLAQERVALEEFYIMISAYRFMKGASDIVRTNKYNVSSEELSNFIKSFNFDFTNGQKEAVSAIFNDVKGAKVMNRLIEGDVGCGKTAVALCGLFCALKSGYQAVMLAPTEVLAEQNYKIISKYLKGFNTGLLVGSQTAKEKKITKEKLSSGEIQVLSCTHAVLQDDVSFNNLAFCVCDEQHRFGVAQRSKLLSKGGNICDLLVMSATPIPRTLSLIIYGDLDVTVIKDKPKQRATVQTNVVPQHKYDGMLQFILNEVKQGRQAYFVCPKIEEDEEGAVMSVTELHRSLSQALPEINFGLLHGKLKDKEKNAVMQDFKAKKYQCLVSTTVIEVGIDVPDATVMVIYGADRFGLSQLHQLRGRVGRSDLKSYCFLLTNSHSDKAMERLAVLVNNNDGFAIADCDYEMRGSGDFLGERQSGRFMNELGSLYYTTQTVLMAKKISDEVLFGNYDLTILKDLARSKYLKLQDVSLN